MSNAASVIQTTEAHFFPVFNRSPLVVDRADGIRVWDTDGKEYLDLTAGWGVTCLGHAHPGLVAALRSQLERCIQAPNCNLSYTPIQAEAAERLIAFAPEPLTRVFFTNSGSEATETGIKLARRATGKPGIIATHKGFHGRTLGAASITAGEHYRKPFEPLMPGASWVPFGDAAAMDDAITHETGAIIVEPIQGEGGVNVPRDGYLRDLRDIADRRGVLLIFDEIQTGVGRTGTPFAANHEDLAPDIMLLGKCLGSGFPVGAALTNDKVSATIRKGDHGGTYVGNPLACAAVACVLREFEDGALLSHAAVASKVVFNALNGLKRDAGDMVVDVRGRGLLAGAELSSAAMATSVAAACLERGVIVNTVQGNTLRLFPSLNVDLSQLEDGLETVRRVVLNQ